MQNLQQTVFQNLNTQTPYNFSSKKITQKHQSFPKYRYQQIQNQFELVDLHDTGYLSQQDIIDYLSDKYQWVNLDVLKALFAKMQWTYPDNVGNQGNAKKIEYVEKKQFCDKYLEKEKKLYHEINGLRYYPQWVRTLEEIYNEEIRAGSPRAYFYFQILNVDLYYEGKPIEWTNVIFKYENHDKKVEYEIQEASHQATHPSFEVWLPSQKDKFFLKFQFLDMHHDDYIYGQSYFSLELEQKMQKKSKAQVPILRSGKKVGNCQIMYRLEPSLQVVRQQINILKQKQASYKETIQQKTKQYEYLQFLWGIRHKSPHRVSKIDVTWMKITRIVIMILLGILGLVCNVLGRCQPISMILAFIFLKNYQNVMLREEKFIITWLDIAGIFIDLVWLTIAADSLSQINFIDLGPARICTYFLLGIKIILFAYMLFAQKAFRSEERRQS